MLVHLCLFVRLSLTSHIVYICTVLFEQINDDDDDDPSHVLTMVSLPLLRMTLCTPDWIVSTEQ